MEATHRLNNSAAHYGLLAIIYGVALLTLMTHTVLHATHQHQHTISATPAALATEACPDKPAHTYTFSITSKGFEPAQITAQRCDELIFANHGSVAVSPAFGPHEHHFDYPGLNDEQALPPHETKTLRLSVAGTFPVHDHDNEGLRANLIVQK